MSEYDNGLVILELITKAQIGVRWLNYTERNADSEKCFGDVVKDYKLKNGNISLFNESTAIAYAYMSLVLPKQNIFDRFDYTEIDTSSFNIEHNSYNETNSSGAVVRHIRNALAHGNITIEDESKFKFVDIDPRHKNSRFEATIEFARFGEFVQNIYGIFKRRFFD